MSKDLIPAERIESKILLFRKNRVMLDSDLAKLYGVSTKVLLQAVKRNVLRFPKDFTYQLTRQEVMALRSQFVTSKKSRGGRRTNPYVFTQEGVAMLSSVLNNKRAVLVNIQIMRTFVKLREMMITHKGLANKIEALERQYKGHDEKFNIVFETIRKLLQPPPEERANKLPIGFYSRKAKGVANGLTIKRK